MKRFTIALSGVLLALLTLPGEGQVYTAVSVTDVDYSPTGGVKVVVSALAGSQVTLQSSSTLAVWTAVTNHFFPGTNTTWTYVDVAAASGPGKMYRAVMVSGTPVLPAKVSGFFKTLVAAGLDLISNPLLASDNVVGVAMHNPSNGYSLYRLRSSRFYDANNYLNGWTSPGMPFGPGDGLFIRNPGPTTVPLTFLGEVPQGTLTTPIPVGQSLLGSKVPQGGGLVTVLGFPALDGDEILQYESASASWSVYDYFFDSWIPNEPTLSAGKSFWLITGSARSWVRTFTVNLLPPFPGVTGPGDPFVSASSSSSTGQVNFFTFNIDASRGRVFDSDGATPVSIPIYGQLYASVTNAESALVPVGVPVGFLSGASAGYINFGNVDVGGLSGSQSVYLQLRVWDSEFGSNYGFARTNGGRTAKSALFSLVLSPPPDVGPGGLPPTANAFPSFNMVAGSPPLGFTNVLASQVVVPGSSVVFNAGATGQPPLTYRWLFEGQTIGGQTNATLMLVNVQFSDAGHYQVVVTNAQGSITSVLATLTVDTGAPRVFVGAQLVAGSMVTVTNTFTSTALVLITLFPGGHIYYTLNGAPPGLGLAYTLPVVITQSVVVRAIAYNADYTLSAEAGPVTINVVTSPSFSQQPVSQSVVQGKPASFSALAAGSSPLSYQWFFNGVPLTGQNASTLLLPSAQLAQAGSYHMQAFNPYGSATSAVALLTVLAPPGFLSQPGPTNVTSGQSATFCVSVIGSGPLSFQWRKNGVNLPGATSSCLTLTNVQVANAGSYSVVVANGADAITSQEAILTLADVAIGPPAQDQFTNRNALAGNTGSLQVNNVGATKEPGEPNHAGEPGGASVWYKWTPSSSGIATIRTSGSAFDTLLGVYTGTAVNALSLVASNDDAGGFFASALRFNALAGTEYEIAVDGFAAAQGSFILSWSLEVTPQILPILISQPQSQTVPAGGAAVFSVTATNSSLVYQWYFNGARVPGATTSSLIVSNVQPFLVGYYAVAATNSLGRGLLSDTATLEIGPFPDVQSQDKVENLLIGRQKLSAASASASVTLGTLGTQVLNTTNATTSFRETNHCGVIGGASRWFKLQPTANGTMGIDTFNSDFDTVLAVYTGDALLGGYPTRLVSCNDNADQTVRWSRVVFPATAGVEYLIAVDGVGTAEGLVTLNWVLGQPPAPPLAPPFTPTIREGQGFALAAPISNGVPPLHYQWLFNTSAIQNETNATFRVDAVQQGNGGTYSVILSNALGTATSVVARVTIDIPLFVGVQRVFQGGLPHFRVSGNASRGFVVQATTNLFNWIPLYTNSTGTLPLAFEDLTTTNRPWRFYRAFPWP